MKKLVHTADNSTIKIKYIYSQAIFFVLFVIFILKSVEKCI